MRLGDIDGVTMAFFMVLMFSGVALVAIVCEYVAHDDDADVSEDATLIGCRDGLAYYMIRISESHVESASASIMAEGGTILDYVPVYKGLDVEILYTMPLDLYAMEGKE